MTASRTATAAAVLLIAVGACNKQAPPPPTPQPTAVDSAAARARADSLAAAARRDSLARAAHADSLARARADSLARAAELARADSVRAQVLRDSAAAAAVLPSGLDATRDAVIAARITFALDRSDLSEESRAALDRKIEVLRAYPQLALQVEGHCDERGPDEYNLALGNRRAAAVKRYLIEHGIAEGRVTIVSYGEERPADPRSTEEAWAVNRRAEFRVTRSAR